MINKLHFDRSFQLIKLIWSGGGIILRYKSFLSGAEGDTMRESLTNYLFLDLGT